MGLFLFTLRNGFAEDRGGQVMCDGILRDYAPGDKLVFKPGECVTLRPGDWHAFWFAKIEEDVDPVHLLVSDYAQRLG